MVDFSKEREREILLAAQQSAEGFGALFDHCFPIVFNFFLKKTGDLETSQNLTVKFFDRLLFEVKSIDPDKADLSLLIYKWAIEEYKRYENVRTIIIFKRESFLPEHLSVVREEDKRLWENELLEKSDCTLVVDTLRTLPFIDRSIVLLRFFEGRKFSEIATILKLHEGTVKVRMNRALDTLTDKIEID